VCIVVFAWQIHPEYPLVLVCNRDEFHERPTASAHWWKDQPRVLGGRDIQAGGSWLAMDRQGRLAVLTNVRQPDMNPTPDQRSRGRLVADYVIGPDDARTGSGRAAASGASHAGFNLLFLDADRLFYVHHRLPDRHAHEPRPPERHRLQPGVYGLSNHRLDTPWPKVRTGKRQLASWLGRPDSSIRDVLEVLHDRTIPADESWPDTGLDPETERMLAPCFVVSPRYGTRSTTAVLIRRDGTVFFLERSFDPEGRPREERGFSWSSGSEG
jgi:uncharacterized protein with NRDE domain